jgi:hypothetical protein
MLFVYNVNIVFFPPINKNINKEREKTGRRSFLRRVITPSYLSFLIFNYLIVFTTLDILIIAYYICNYNTNNSKYDICNYKYITICYN